jgi:PilZ domain
VKGQNDERRRQPRYTVDGIFGTLVPSTHVTLLNLSRYGVAIRMPFRLPIGQSFLFEFRHLGRTARMEIEVTWCSRHGRGLFRLPGSGYVVGGRVVDIHRDTSGGIWAGVQPDRQMAV